MTAKSSVGKLATITRQMCDGRVRYGYRHYGAHTGRWSGTGVQPQNLPRVSSKWGEADIDVRACFEAPLGYRLVVTDLNSIETRVLAWLVKCQPLIAVFEEGRDPYIDFASLWFSIPYSEVTKEQRQLSKPVILGCGYGLGGGDIRMKCCHHLRDQECAESRGQEYCCCKKPGDEYKTGLWRYADKMGVPMTQEQAHDAVNRYRQMYWEVPEFWRGIDAVAVEAAISGRTQTWLGITVGAIPGKLLWMKLPSERRLHYLRPRVQEGKFGKLEITCTRYERNNWQSERLYGGKLTENLVQAIARDVLAEGMLRADEAGLTIVGHCHDEIICCEPEHSSEEKLQLLLDAMTRPMPWAPDLDLKAEGYAEKVYRK